MESRSANRCPITQVMEFGSADFGSHSETHWKSSILKAIGNTEKSNMKMGCNFDFRL